MDVSNRPDHEFWVDSAQAWISTVERDSNRTHLLDPLLDQLLGDVAGKRVLDIGCGEGRVVRKLCDRGAVATGLDPIPQLLEQARATGPGEFVEGFAESLPFDDASFDLVVAYLSLCDVRGYREAIAEQVRVLKPGGRVILIDIHPMASAFPYWAKDEQGIKLYKKVDRYFEERAELVEWSGIRVYNHHRPMTGVFQEYLKHGMMLTFFEEPTPTPEAGALKPHLLEEFRVPNFLATVWTKPA